MREPNGICWLCDGPAPEGDLACPECWQYAKARVGVPELKEKGKASCLRGAYYTLSDFDRKLR